MIGSRADRLVVIDMQHAFADDGSPWQTPGFDAAAANVLRLADAFGDRTIFTRFLPPSRAAGSWAGYYRKWQFARRRNEIWDLVEPWHGRPTLDFSTFAKWDARMRAVVGRASAVVLCGVSTDCCVLATALAAVDGGAQVRVVADACAADPALHEIALRLLRQRDPQLTITMTEIELAMSTISVGTE
jgi:nicotinamidase-related amidase